MSRARRRALGLSPLLVVFFASLLAGCTPTTSGPSSATIPPSQGGDPQANPGGPTPTAPPGTSPPAPMDGGMHAPVVLTLSSTGQDAATGEMSFLAVVEVNAPPGFPLTLTTSLPPGSQLTAGLAQETLTPSQPGQLQRTFKVRGALTPQAPMKLILNGIAPDKSSGLHAERAYPPPVSGPPPRTVGPLLPPGGRPPGPVPR